MEKLLILDTSAIMYRSHFAMLNLMNKKGFSTGAIFGFVKQLEQALNEVNPKYVACAYDVKKSELNRRKILESYKANRSDMPIELVNQVDVIKNIIENFGVNSFSSKGYEADDIIATLTTFGINNNLEVHIYTGDKDIQQLVTKNNNVFIHLLGKDIVSTYEGVKEHLGVYPNQIPDFFGLKGDSSDGIPGVVGIGDKTGAKLIKEYDTLENIYENIDNIKGKLKEKLINGKDLAYISRDLAKVNRNIDLGLNLSSLKQKKMNNSILKEIFLEYELNSFLELLEEEKEEIKIEHKDSNFNEIKEVLNNTKIASIFMDNEFFSCYTNDTLYICPNKKEQTLFDNEIDLGKIQTNANLIVYDAKKYMHLDMKLNNFFDILIASYVIDTNDKFEIEHILNKYSNIKLEILDKKKLKNITLEELKERHIKICYGIFKAYDKMIQKLKEVDIKNTYEVIEKPLISILYSMEKNGICIDKNALNKLYNEFNFIVQKEKKEIYRLANTNDFNIESPTQLADILFNKLNLPPIKKTKRGYSTDAQVLETLANNGAEIAKHLLNFRYYQKLISTYIEPLPNYADSLNRIHSIFNGTGTVTGRLSSQNPNLQNIPARTDEGNMIRNCFVADKNMKLVSFDYSQIELRVLAELSNDQNLINAYNNDLDLHTETAKKIFPGEEITKEMRNIGKVVNFSVLYGKTPFGLSKELNISMKDAKKYIETYFKTYSGVSKFIEKVVDDCSKNLYVETLFGTRRYIPEINSNNNNIYEEAKRRAINTVVQGTAANIIKIVMIKLFEKGYKMLVQVHDELIFELPEKDAEKLSLEIKEIMENTITFKNVKLKTNYKIANKWGGLK